MSLEAVDLFHQLAQNDFGFFQKIRSIASLMTREVKTLTLDHTYEQAAALFQRGGFRHAPVIEDGEVVGILSDRDLLRHRPPSLGTAAESDTDHRALQTPVSRLMTRHPAAVVADASPEAALTLMLDRHVDSVVVFDGRKRLVGIVTPTDFMKTVLLFHRVCTGTTDLVRFRLVDLDMSRGLPLDLIFSRGARSVRDVMTKEVVTVDKSEILDTAIECMQSLEVRHLPVTNDRGQLIGMLSDREILTHLPLPVPRQGLRSRESRFRERLFATLGRSATRVNVSLLMSREPATLRPEALLTDAIALLMEKRVSGLPVVEDDGRLSGILTTTDILRVFRVITQIGSIVASSQKA